MGQTLLIKNNSPCITPLRSRVDAIQRLKKVISNPPVLVMPNNKGHFTLVSDTSGVACGAAPHATPIQRLKKGISNPPVLVMPNNKGHFTLVSDTSGVACGTVPYQEQKGRLRLVGYNSKKLPPAAIRYSISELESSGLADNIHSFKHILRNTLQLS